MGDVVYQAMCESGEGLIKKFGFDPEAHHAYIDRIFARFQNPFLEDETQRVAREPIRKLAPTDRLVKPFDLTDDEYAALQVFAKKVAAALKRAIPCRKVGMAVLGLEVPHAHIHLIPMQNEGDMDFRREKLHPASERMEQIAQSIASNL